VLDLAKSTTEFISKLYRGLAVRDVLDDTLYLKDINTRWSDLFNDILACLVIEFAKVC
jgi:hypothetical protein